MKLYIKRSTQKKIFKQKSYREYFRQALILLPFSLIFSLAWSYVFLNNLSIDFNWGEQIILQTGIYLAAVILLIKPILPLIFCMVLALLSLTSFIWPLPRLLPLHNFWEQTFVQIKDAALWTFEATQEGIVRPDNYPLYVGVLAILLAIIFVWRENLPFALAFFILLPFLGASGSAATDPSNILALLFCLIPLIHAFTQHRPFRQEAYLKPPVLLIILVLLFAFIFQSFVPDDFFQNKTFASQISQLRKRLKAPEIVNYFEFSLRDAGYYPLHQDLGGPLTLNHELFMKVSGPAQPLRLRGAISENYNGSAWISEEMEPNYIFDNQSTHGIQAEVFAYPSVLKQSQDLLKQLFSESEIHITPTRQPIQVVFNGGRPLQIISDEQAELNYYYNRGGQIYAGEEISSGYSVKGYLAKEIGNSQKFEILGQALHQGKIGLVEREPSSKYQDIVKAHDEHLYEIVYGSRQKDSEALFTAFVQLLEHLRDNYTYTTDVNYPNPQQDFLESFLLHKEGYCTYFATALSLLAREMGIEARYVEGFLVPAVDAGSYLGESSAQQYTRDVLSDSAHAWVELNFEGFGWYPFDATPISVLNGFANQDLDNNQKPEPSKPENRESETPSESNREETTPTMSAPSEQRTTQPTRTPGVKPTQQPSQRTEQPPQSLPSGLNLTLLIILGLLLTLALIAYLLYRRAKQYYRRRHDTQLLLAKANKYGQRQLLEKVWIDIKHLYSITGGSLPENKTLQQKFEILTDNLGLESSSAYHSYLSLETVFFGEIDLSPENLRLVLEFYQSLEDILKTTKAYHRHWFWKRYLFPPASARYKA